MFKDLNKGNLDDALSREEPAPEMERRKFDRRKVDQDLKDILQRVTYMLREHDGVNEILDGISDGFFTLNRNWQFTYLNKVAENIFKKKSLDLVSRNIWIEYPQFVGSLLEIEAKRSLKEQIPVSLEIKGILDDNWYGIRSFPSSKGLSAFIRDVTQGKKLENEMARFDRLNSLGEMAACIGHELRNPMTAVRGFLQLLGEREAGVPLKDYFDLMIEELDRCNEIITEFLSLAKNRVLNLELSNLNEILNSVAPLALSEGLMLDKNVVFELSEVPDLLLDKNEIKQLILNLIHNALEAMESGKMITVRTYQEKNDLVLEVKDQGRGIDDSVLDKIGNPFITTKENGVGLGLAVCYSIAVRHHAVITFDTNGEGTTFFVKFKMTN